MKTSWRLGLAVVWLLASSACTETSLLGEGAECVASSQCQTGLICDLAAEPSVCTTEGSAPPQVDAAAPVIDGGPVVDAAPSQPDAAPPPIDAAVPDAAISL